MLATSERETLSFPQQLDVKAMAQETGPCLSVVIPLEFSSVTSDQPLRSALLGARELLQSRDLNPAGYLAPLETMSAEDLRRASETAAALAFFSSGEKSWQFALPFPAVGAAHLADHFYVTSLLKTAQVEQEFYILALSQKHVRLIRCTLAASEEVELPESIPTNLIEFEQRRQPDHRLENRAHGGQVGKPHGAHSGMIVAFGTSSDADQKDEYLYHFYNELDKQLQQFLRPHPLPLVIAGVDYEIALYHSVSEYTNLAPGGVQGAADGLKGGELHARALTVVQSLLEARVEKALGQYEKAGGDRIRSSVPEIVEAAYDGRILQLFLAEGGRMAGSYDLATRTVCQTDGAMNDLLELAALQTVAHAGDVLILPQERVPGGGLAAATLRF